MESQAAFDRESMALRVRKAASRHGLNATDLGRALDLKKSAVSNYWNGATTWPVDKIFALADMVKVNARWLVSGDGPQQPPIEVEDATETVMVPEIDLAYGMGGTFIESAIVESKAIPFPKPWLRTFTKSDVKHLFFARGDGDSMMPTILDQDIVLIDRSENSITRQDRIWAIAYGEIGMLKRIRAMPDGTYKIMSDNPTVDPEIAADGEMFVIGRVIAVIRKT
ncbi:MAG: S24 family peptidase [Blastomonas sp.]